MKKGFTLVELLAVIAILIFILIIAMPNVIDIFSASKEKALGNSAKILLKKVEEKMVEDQSFDPTTLDINNISNSIEVEISGVTEIKFNMSNNNVIIEMHGGEQYGNYVAYGVKDYLKTAAASDFPTPDACFTFDSGTNTITDYDNACTKDVIIPESIGGTTVTAIGLDGFSTNSLTSVYIPSTITNIGVGGFKSNNFTEIIIPNTVTSIGNSSFFSNAENKYLSISSGLTILPYESFASNTKLEVVEIPEGITTIGEISFKGNEALKSIALPNSVKTIETLAFDSCLKLKSINLPQSLTTIGDSAFTETAIEDLTVPGSIQNISVGMVASTNDKEGLNELILKEGVITVGNTAFSAAKIDIISLPNTLTTIGVQSFYNNDLETIYIPNSVTTINDEAFAGNTNLIEVIIDNASGNVTLGTNPFGGVVPTYLR